MTIVHVTFIPELSFFVRVIHLIYRPCIVHCAFFLYWHRACIFGPWVICVFCLNVLLFVIYANKYFYVYCVYIILNIYQLYIVLIISNRRWTILIPIVSKLQNYFNFFEILDFLYTLSCRCLVKSVTNLAKVCDQNYQYILLLL